MICPACISEGAAGCSVKSKAKSASSRANGKLGGRAKLPAHNPLLHRIEKDSRFKKRLEHCAGCGARTEFKAKASKP
jgi:hypothetical protein